MELSYDFFAQFADEQKENLDFLKAADTVEILRTERPSFLTADEMLLMHEAIGFPPDSPVKLGLLESATNRAANAHWYGHENSIGKLAAEACIGIVQNHPFVDGNKRVAFMAACSFLYKNGCCPDDCRGLANMLLAVARHDVGAEEFGEWLEQNITMTNNQSMTTSM